MMFPTAFLLAAGLSLGGMNAESGTQKFDSYTRAYHAAADAHRPMLVVLNPPDSQVSVGGAIDVDALRRDVELAGVLGDYVVAEIDTGTEHGRKVHELFGSKALPRIVVIDADQKWQVYRTSAQLEKPALKSVLERYRGGATAAPVQWATQQYLTPSYCPNCQRF